MFALSIHADYRCRQSGACCSADWDVPVELPVYRSLAEAVASGRLHTAAAAASLEPFIVEPGLPDGAGAMLERTDTGACVFLEHDPRLCIVHRDLGEDALPATCRHFPRLAVRDPRGTFVTLSHFCPTAASMLFRTDVPLEIVAFPAAFPFRDYDGLAVTDDDLPPLLHPRMLMDLEGYGAWERHMIARCAGGGGPESIVATLARDAVQLRRWRPGAVSMADAVKLLRPEYVAVPPPRSLLGSLERYREVMNAVPPELAPASDERGVADAFAAYVMPAWRQFTSPIAHYLAAKAFASWTAYQGRGIASVVRGLESALALVRVEAARQCRAARRPLDQALMLEAFRAADFILNHLAVGEDLARAWSRVEQEADQLNTATTGP